MVCAALTRAQGYAFTIWCERLGTSHELSVKPLQALVPFPGALKWRRVAYAGIPIVFARTD